MNAGYITRVSIGRLFAFQFGYARIRLLAALIGLASMMLGPVSTSAQGKQSTNTPPQKEEPIRLKTDLVEIRAVVTDKKGTRITNLNKSDFEVTENGRHQVISFFSAENATSPAEKPTDPAAPSPREERKTTGLARDARRTVVFFVDTLHLSQTSLIRLKLVMSNFIDNQLQKTDLAAIITSGLPLGMYSQLTQNRQILHRAVERLSLTGGDHDSLFTPYLAAKVEEGAPYALEAAMNIVRAEEHLPEDDRFGSVVPAITVSRARQINAEALYKRRVTLMALRSVAERLSEMPGQRLIVFLSDGFTLLDRGSVDSSELQSATSRAVLAGVVITTVDVKGLKPLSFFDASRRSPTSDPRSSTYLMNYLTQGDRDLETGLVRIAKETGGEPFLNTNDLAGALKKSLDDNSSYYALSYYPSTAGDPRSFRTLKVSIKGHPDYLVRAQSGFIAAEFLRKKPEGSTDPDKLVLNAMNSALATTGIDVNASAVFLPLETDKAQVTLSIFISAQKLGYLSDGDNRTTRLELMLAIVDEAGSVAGITQDKTRIRLSNASFDEAKLGTYRYAKRLALKPGSYQVRIGVRNPETELIGTAAAWIQVPEVGSKKIVLSGVLTARIETPGAEPMDSAISQPADSAISQPNVIDGVNLFHPADTLLYKCRAYKVPLKDADINSLSARAQIFQNGLVVLEDESRQLSTLVSEKQTDSLEFTGRMALSGLKPGYAEFRVTVSDARSGKPITSTTSIEIR
jgi:VWFA-related protein